MTDPSLSNPAYRSLSDQQLSEIDDLCDRFDRELVNGDRPSIEAFLAGVSEASRDYLLTELLVMECESRTRQGDIPRPENYIQRFPQQKGVIANVFLSPPNTQRLEATISNGDDTVLTQVEVPTRLGNYRLIEEIARGGMGVVWLAEQLKPVRRRVALKLIKSELTSNEVMARFEAEKQALAMMDHPNIAKVLDAGTNDDRPFFVMELVNGIPITQYCDANKLGVDQRLKLFVSVCKAVQHAHLKGIIHRDLKPSNVLVTVIDDEAIPKVIDFGLAKAVEQDLPLTDLTMMTQFGKVVGTVQYMSPEQTELKGGDADDVDTRTDVYSLGVLLYELLAGSTPLDKETLARSALFKVLEIIRKEDPPRPSNRLSSSSNDANSDICDQRSTHLARLQQLLKGELDWVVMKALEKDRNRRYQTANDLAQDITNYLTGGAVAARPPSTWYQVKKFASRNRGPVTAMIAIGVVLLGGIAGTTYGLIRANQKTTEAEQERRKAEASAKLALLEKDNSRKNEERAIGAEKLASAEAKRAHDSEASAKFQLAVARYDVDRTVEARSILHQIPEDYRDNFEWHYCNRRFQGSDVTCYGHTNEVYEVAFTPDGKRVVSAGAGGKIRLWDSATGQELGTIEGHEGRVSSLAISTDGSYIASAGYDGSVRLMNAMSGEIIRKMDGHSNAITCLALSLSGNRIASASDDKTIKLWDEKTGEEIISITGHTAAVVGVAFSPDGTQLASSSRDQTVRIWDSRTGEQIAIVQQGRPNIRRVAFSPDGRRLVTIDYGGYRLWDTKTWRPISVAGGAHVGLVHCVAFSPDGTQFATAGDGTKIKLWDTETGKLAATLTGHGKSVWGIAYSPNGSRLVSGSEDKTVKIWDTSGGNELTLRESTNKVYSVAFSSDGRQLASGEEDGTVILRKAQTSEVKFTLKGHTGDVNELSFSPDGNRLASASDDHTVRLWNTHTGEEVAVLNGHTAWVRGVAFSPDGTAIATAGWDGTLKLWDANSFNETASLKGHRGGLYCVAFSPDGSRLASASNDRTIKIWDTRTGREMSTFQVTPALVRSVAFGPRGERLVSAGYDPKARVWDVASSEQIVTANSSGADFGVTFSPDGKRFATVGASPGVRLFDAQSGQEIMILDSGSGGVSAVTFSPDGTRLAGAIHDGTVRIWDATQIHETTILTGHTDTLTSVTFSADGSRIYSESEKEKLVWDVARQEKIQDAMWEPPEVITHASSDGRWFVTTESKNVVLVDLAFKNTPDEKAYRTTKARFEPSWHLEQAKAATISENWYAAVFQYALLMKSDSDQASFYDGLHSSFRKLDSQFERQELDIEAHLAMVVKESLKLPRGNKLPEINVGDAQTINNATWEKVKTPDAFEQSPLTDLEFSRYRELIRQHPRNVYYNTLATAEYRMGNYQGAVDAALMSVELSSPEEIFPGGYAVLAMSYSELGQTNTANDYRERFIESMKRDAFKNDQECKSFSTEVEKKFRIPSNALDERT